MANTIFGVEFLYVTLGLYFFKKIKPFGLLLRLLTLQVVACSSTDD